MNHHTPFATPAFSSARRAHRQPRAHRTHALARAAAHAACRALSTLSSIAAGGLLLASPGAFAVSYTWTNGDFVAGTTAPSPLAAGDVLNINAGGNKVFNGASGNFTNGGTVNWNADALYLANGAAVVNNALWNINGNLSLAYNGGNQPSFINNGTLRKTSGSGAATIGDTLGFTNNGTLDVQAGTLNFIGGSTFNAGSVFSGAGTVAAVQGVNVFSGSYTSANLLLAGGVHSGNGAVANGTTTLSGGNVTGTWRLASGQTMVAVDGGNKIFDGSSSVFTNQGSFAWNSTNALYLQNGAIFRNTGVFTANQNTALLYNGGNTTAWENNAGGTLRAAAGVTLTVGSAGLVNNGGALDAAAGASIRSTGAVFNNGTQFTGAGSNVAAGSNSFNGTFNSANLVIEGGTQTGGNAVMTGNTGWIGGNLAGSWALASGQTLRGDSGGNKILSGTATVFTNNGNVAWNTGNALYLDNGAVFVNQGAFVANASTSIVYNGGATPGFVNSATGTVRAAAGQTLTVGNAAGFANNGGTLDAAAGGSIVYQDASFNAGTRFTGSGSNVAAGTTRFAGAFNSQNLVLQDGTHDGTAAVASGSTRWTGGSVRGTWTVASGQLLQAGNGNNKTVDGSATVLTNAGTIDWATGNALYLSNAARLVNQGLFVASTTTSAAYNGGNAPAFENTASGTVRAAAGVTLTLGNALGFVNNGGALDAASGGSIVHVNGQFNAGTRFTGAGSNVAAGNNGFAGSITSANLDLRDGTHSGNAAVLNGNTAFSGGTLQGSWTVASGQTLRGVDGNNKTVNGTTTVLTNAGTLAWATGNQLYLTNGARFDNSGTLNFSADGGLAYNGGNQPTVVNSGLIVKTGGTGTSTIGDVLGFSNTGTVDVQTGTIALPPNFSNAGMLRGSGSFAVNGTLANAGTVAPGAGTSVGTLGLSGNYSQAAGGRFAVDLQSLALHDLFNISGTAALNGVLALSCFANCSLAVGDTFTILDAVGDLTGSFASVTLSGFQTGAFNVVYDTVADRVQLVVTQAVTAAVPEPGTVALWLAGLGALGFVVRRRAGSSTQG